MSGSGQTQLMTTKGASVWHVAGHGITTTTIAPAPVTISLATGTRNS